jgi:pimeloyl-ACP methyl ester carboxylesterase
MAGPPGLHIDFYDHAGGREAMVRLRPGHGPTVVAALPMFEEANRTRAAMVDVLRRLAARGICSALPDLPGTGESLKRTSDVSLVDWREAFAAACAALPQPVHVIAWRSGTLVDGAADVASRWYLAPQSGAALIRELTRVRGLGGGEDYAGNLLSGAMSEGLAAAQPTSSGPLRVVRLESDAKAADRKLTAAPLWRKSEPDSDPGFQQQVADDIADWIAAQQAGGSV